MNPAIPTRPDAAHVQQADLTEQQIVDQAREVMDRCNWTIGRLAEEWTRRFANGRGDGEFGQLIGLDRSQVTQRRICWEKFGPDRSRWPSLPFSHFREAINWDDGPGMLDWAESNNASLREMQNYRRKRTEETNLRRGELIPSPEERPVRVIDAPRPRPRPEPLDDGPEVLEAEYTVTTSVRPVDATPANPDQSPARPPSNATAGQPVAHAPARGGKADPPTWGGVTALLAAWVKVASPAERTAKGQELMTLSLGMLPDTGWPTLCGPIQSLLRTIEDIAGPDTLRRLARELTVWSDRYPPQSDEPASVDDAFALSSAPIEPTEAGVTAHQLILNSWNMLDGFRTAARLSPARRRAMTSRLSDPWWRDNWQRAMDVLQQTRDGFLTGDNPRGWKANLDWFLRPDTVLKLIEGAYHEDGRSRTESERDRAFRSVFDDLRDQITE